MNLKLSFEISICLVENFEIFIFSCRHALGKTFPEGADDVRPISKYFSTIAVLVCLG